MERKYDKKVKGCVDSIMWRIDEAISGLKNLGISSEDDEAYITVCDRDIEDVVIQETFSLTCCDITPLSRPTLEQSVQYELKETIENHESFYFSDVYEVNGKMYLEISWRD